MPWMDMGITGQPVAADFDGDALADPAVLDAGGTFWLLQSSRDYALSGVYVLGVTGPATAGDLDGDQLADLVVLDASGVLHAWLSASSYAKTTGQLNIAGQPVAADFDGDDLDDLAVVTSAGGWHVWLSGQQWGYNGHYALGSTGSPMAGDFDGDGLADPAERIGTNMFRVWLSSAGYQPQGPLVPGRFIDLVTDQDNDLIPDELEQRVDAILKMEQEAAQRCMTAAQSNILFNAIFSLARQYDFHPHTVTLETEYAAILERLTSGSVTNDTDMNAITERMGAIENELREDPAFAMFVDSIDRIGEAKRRAAGRKYPRHGPSPVFAQLQRGDILLVHNGGLMGRLPYALSFSHAGTYQGNSLIYESTKDNIANGVALRPLENSFNHENMRVAFGRSRVNTAAEVCNALDWAQAKWGVNGTTHYNVWFFNKECDDELYCSQLVWKIHKHLGVDVDSNDTIYHIKAASYAALAGVPWPHRMLAMSMLCYAVVRPGVMPDEIFWDNNVTFYADGIYHAAAEATATGPSKIEVLTLPRKACLCAVRSKGEYNPAGTPFLYSWTITACFANGDQVPIVASVDISGENSRTFQVPNDRIDSETGQLNALSRLIIRVQTKTALGVTQPAVEQVFRMQ